MHINGKNYECSKLLLAAMSGVLIDFPATYVDNAQTIAGEHHAFIQHDGKMVRVVVGKYPTSRKARLISKILLKKALVELAPPSPPPLNPPVWRNDNSRPSNGYYHREGESRYVPRETSHSYPSGEWK